MTPSLLLFAAAAGTVLVTLTWARTRHLVRVESRQVRSRLGIKGRWDDAFDVDDDELLLDPTIELPPRRSMVLVVGDSFDDSQQGRRLAATLRAADLNIKPSEWLALAVIVGMVCYIVAELAFMQGIVISSVLGTLSGVIIPWLVLRSRRDRRLQNFNTQLPTVAELVSNSLRAGLALQGALEMVTREMVDPAREEFGIVVREVRLGGSLDDALDALETRMPSKDLGVMITALKVQRIAGGNLIKSMGELSRTLIERQRTTEEIKTMMAEAKFTAYIMPVLSIGALALLNRAQPGFLDVLFWTFPGWVVLTVFVALQVVGFLLVQRFARIKV
jgi:tight adherence protein B